MQCSLKECDDEIVGTAVVFSGIPDEDEAFDLELQRFLGDDDSEDEMAYLVVHPVCFKNLFDELARRQSTSTLQVAMGPVGEVIRALTEEEEEDEA